MTPFETAFASAAIVFLFALAGLWAFVMTCRWLRDLSPHLRGDRRDGRP